MQITSFGTTDRGRVRHANEDALFIDGAHQLYAVADGLGGLPGGAEASHRIVELLGQAMRRVDSAEERIDLSELMTRIHRIVSKEGLEAHPVTGSGSTLTIGQIVGDQLLIGHVGDSAAYLLRGAALKKLTIDHTMAQQLIEHEGEGARDFMPPEYPHTLTRCVGQGDTLRVDRTRLRVELGDRLLFCTDGLNKVLSEAQIREKLMQASTPEDACKSLTRMANDHQGPDNITLIVLHIT